MVRENLSSILPRSKSTSDNGKGSYLIGKVYGVTTTANTPTKKMYDKVGGPLALGTIFYGEYNNSKNISEIDLKTLPTAKPFFPNQKYYPLVNELVLLFELPAIASQVTNSNSQTYYISVINVWDNVHNNSQRFKKEDKLGKTFVEKDNVSNLTPYEGDYILEGRFGHGLRFGSTVKSLGNSWSKTGNDGDPITILTNGYKSLVDSLATYNENINDDDASIYLTSTQQIPITPDRNDILNPITKPISVSKYQGKPQLLFNAGRIVINSRTDDVLIFAKSNVEINTNNVINLNARERNHLNSPLNFIGTKKNGQLPTEPLLLGNKTISLLSKILSAISSFASSASSVVSTPTGTPIPTLNTAGNQLSSRLNDLIGELEKIISKENFTT